MRIRIALLALASLAVVAAGCGGGDKSSSAADATTATEEVATETTTSTAAEDRTDTSGVTAIGDLSKECLSLVGVGAKYAQALQAAGGATASGDYSTYADSFDEFAADAPPAIRDDLEVIAKNFGKYAEAVKGLDLSGGQIPSADQLQKLQEISKTLDQPELQKAQANVSAWMEENCKSG
jgi:hypothetical protein